MLTVSRLDGTASSRGPVTGNPVALPLHRWTLLEVALAGASLSASLRTPPSGWVRDLPAALLPRAAAHPLVAGHARHTTPELTLTKNAEAFLSGYSERSAVPIIPMIKETIWITGRDVRQIIS